MPTDLTERGPNSSICKALTGDFGDPPSTGTVGEPYPGYDGVGSSPGNHQTTTASTASISSNSAPSSTLPSPAPLPPTAWAEDCPIHRKFLARLEGEIDNQGTIAVLRDGLQHGPHDLDPFYSTPSAENATARQRFHQNRFAVTRQLRCRHDES
ncbi:MAG: hypothetical protein OXE73_06880 [Gammaproteobacteria bacterium]|nr:hypothetical protein [Gammaproteobacteria bacterium]